MKKTTLILCLFFLTAFGVAQTVQPPARPPAPPAHADTDTPAKDHKITPEEAKELFQSVDEILQFASRRTQLPVKHPVKKAMVSRADVEKYIGDKFKDDADRIRFERSELVLKKFGLLPRRFSLHDFLIKLLGEQVAGYYDEKTKTMNLLNWVEFDMQKPVMAHELTHALQDQSFDLDKLMRKDEEIEKRGPEDFNALISIDEASTARSAVMEGQAMVVLLDYILAPAGRTVADSPKMVDMMQSQMDKSTDSPLLESAPLLLREELEFPYGKGMKFVAELLASGGPELAYTKVLERMPTTSREIMEPQEYLAGHHVAPLLLPDMGFLNKEFEPFDAGAVGELDVNIMLKQYTDETTANRLSPHWRGGSYYAVGRRGVKATDPNSSAHVGLIYVSRWSTDAVAQEFAKIYASSLPGRYSKLEHGPTSAAHPGRDYFLSADGPILIQQTGNLVVAVESFDQALAEKLTSLLMLRLAQKTVSANDLESVLTQMDKASLSFKSAQADYQQDLYQKVVDETETQSGQIYFRRSAQGLDAAVLLARPSERQLVFKDGKGLLYEKKIDQLTERQLGNDKGDIEAFISLGFGGRGHDLLKNYEVTLQGWETIDKVATAKLQLIPTKPRLRSMFTRVVLWVDPQRDVLLKQQFFEPDGDYKLAYYKNIRYNAPVPEEAFSIKTTAHTAHLTAQ